MKAQEFDQLSKAERIATAKNWFRKKTKSERRQLIQDYLNSNITHVYRDLMDFEIVKVYVYMTQ